MAKSEESLVDKIKLIEKNATPKNMEIIYKELNYLSKNESNLKKHLKEACKLINLIGTYLVKGEGLNTTESQLIFDTFCDLDFMKLLLNYSSFDIYQINLEIITTFSFLMINIKSTTYLYYFFSKNLLNRIINKDYSKYDEEFLSYYVNFIKSLSLRLDEVTVNLFYNDKANSFPIIENVLKLYNHRDSMVRNVVRNIVLNILKIKVPSIENHFTELPSISYLANIACHLRDICIQINDEMAKKNINNLHYLYDDLIDEATYIDDLLNLNLTKINYIILNCLFYYLILPIICGAISEKTNRISKKVALFLIIFFFINMKNEIFKNCLFTLLFFEQINTDLIYFLVIPPEKKNYSFYPENNKEITFCTFISENYSYKFLSTMVEKDNIIYNKYKNKYPQIKEVMQKNNGSKNKEKLEISIISYFNEEESNKMGQYHLNLSMSTGLGVGQYAKENTGEIYNICFLCSINQMFIDLKGEEKKDNTFLNYEKNIIKENLDKIIENLNGNDEEMIILINMLLFVVQSRDVNICSNLLKHAGLENIREKTIISKSKDRNLNLNEKKKPDKEQIQQVIPELSFNNNNFNYTNDYFLLTKDAKNKLFNTIKLPLLLSNQLLIKYKNKENKNIEKEEKKEENEEKIEIKEEKNEIEEEKEEKIEKKEEMVEKDEYFILNTYLRPFSYKLILLNIMNLSFNSNNKFELKKEKKLYENFLKNIEDSYKEVLGNILQILKQISEYKEEGYNKFYRQWKIYKKSYENKSTIELIKDEIMNTTFLLLPDEYEKSKDEEYPQEISRKDLNNKKIYFENCLLLFMMLHDIREILLNDPSFFRGNSSFNLIKNNFPLNIKKDDITDFSINSEYDIEKINPTKIYRKPVSYKLQNSENYEVGELIIYNKHIYFANVINKTSVKINLKCNLKSIGLFINNYDDEKNIINILVHNSEEYEDDDNMKKNDNNDDENKQENIHIIVRFDEETIKVETSQKINEKILSINNEERLAFDGYFNEINNSLKEDF